MPSLPVLWGEIACLTCLCFQKASQSKAEKQLQQTWHTYLHSCLPSSSHLTRGFCCSFPSSALMCLLKTQVRRTVLLGGPAFISRLLHFQKAHQHQTWKNCSRNSVPAYIMWYRQVLLSLAAASQFGSRLFPEHRHMGQDIWPWTPLFLRDTMQSWTGKGCGETTCSCHSSFLIWLCRRQTAQWDKNNYKKISMLVID